jgi:hypothetical protein
MRKSRFSLARYAVLSGTAFSLSLAVSAADISLPDPSADPHDISGIWKGPSMREVGRMGIWRPVEGGEPPFTEAGLALYKKRREADKATHPFHPLGTECAPHGYPGMAGGQIIQTPGQITFLGNFHAIDIVHMNGRHPKDLRPTFTGHSIGHWEGATLVIDTVGYHEGGWLDYTGTPAGAQLHLIEHIKKVTIAGKVGLEAVATVIDPENYTKPWNVRRVSRLNSAQTLEEDVCEGDLDKERPSYVFDKTVPGVPGNATSGNN